MPFEALIKAKSLTTLRMFIMNYGMWLATTLKFNWWSWMKLLKSLGLKESQKCSKIMLNEPHITKWDTCKTNWHVRIHGKLHIHVQLKSHQRVRKGESKSEFEGCRACNTQTIFYIVGFEAKGARTLITHTNTFLVWMTFIIKLLFMFF
jgi:hypothetical protein